MTQQTAAQNSSALRDPQPTNSGAKIRASELLESIRHSADLDRRSSDQRGPVESMTRTAGFGGFAPVGSGGVFEVRARGEVVWSRKTAGHFPDIKELKQVVELKQLVRDRIAPGKDLGHADH